MERTILTTAGVARRLGWSKAKVKRAAHAGTLPTVGKIDGARGAYLFDAAAIERCDAHHDGHDCTVPGECGRALAAMCERTRGRS
jgi:hypothetical protein